jgi:hypothetical protein
MLFKGSVPFAIDLIPQVLVKPLFQVAGLLGFFGCVG